MLVADIAASLLRQVSTLQQELRELNDVLLEKEGALAAVAAEKDAYYAKVCAILGGLHA